MKDSEYGMTADKLAVHSHHVLHYWVAHKGGQHSKCGCGAVKNTLTGEITYG